MRNKLTQLFFLVTLLLAIQPSGRSQILAVTDLDLNPGGIIHDVAYDPINSCYIVVGNFTSIGVHTRKNIAFLDKESLQVLNHSYLNPFNDIDGEIRCVDVVVKQTIFDKTTHLYIGGNFELITTSTGTYTRKGIAKFTRTQPNALPIPPWPNFTLSSWDPKLYVAPFDVGYESEGVEDILISNDTVFFVGRFYGVNYISPSIFDDRHCFAAYTLPGTLLNYTLPIAIPDWLGTKIYRLKKINGNIYICGKFSNTGRIYKMDSSGNFAAGFNAPANSNPYYDFSAIDDSLIIAHWDVGADNETADRYTILRQSNGTTKFDHSFYNMGTSSGFYNLAVRNDNFYTTTQTIGNSLVSYVSIPNALPLTPSNYNWNGNATHNLSVEYMGNLKIAGDHLFVSSTNLTTLGGQTRNQFGVFCIEPLNAKFFTVSDSTICPEQIITYTIPPVDFADGYKWEYTGNGCDLQDNGGVDNVPLYLDGIDNNSIQVEFTSAFTLGQLKVTPYSKCNNGTLLFSNTITTNIISNPLPHVNAGLDTSLTCIRDSIVLYGYSDSAVVSHEWVYPMPGTNIIGQHDTITEVGDYVFKVVDALGCPNYDTVNVWMDDAKPTAFPPTGIYELTCLETEKTFLGSTSSPNTTEHWLDLADTSQTPLPNPIVINVPGSYQFVVTDTINGCPKDTGIFVINNFNPPNVTVLGYPNFNVAAALDTLTCYENNLSLTCSSDTLNTTASWTSQDTSAFYGNNLDISSGGTYYIHVINNTNGCENFLPIIISEYLNVPHAHAPADNSLNCSVDSLILDGASLSAGALLEWNGGTVLSATDPVIIYDSGTYYLTVTDPENGCTTIDSVVISQDNSINVFAGDDALFCDQSLVNLTAEYAGSITGINYLWSNGSTSSNAIFTAGQNQYAAVQVFGDNGCYGVDTVFLNLPPTPVIQFESFKPCDDGPSGQIVAEPLLGLEPFQYSIDQGITYQSSPTFNGLYIGTYPIWVKDSLNCDYEFQAVIDANSSLPTPSFLFSTYNYTSDTVIVIDVSNPPTDSTIWIFSNEIIVLENNPTGPMILLPDTGVFEITMQAYYGNCLVELNKTIYASPYDSLAANQFNQNGIKSIGLYPNPNTGNFTVTVEFYKSQRASLVVQDMLGYNYVYNQYEESFVISENINLSSNAIDGTYVLKIVSEFDSAYITFIVAR